MVLVSYILCSYFSILQTKFSDREGHKARRVGLEAMPLNQHIEGRHSKPTVCLGVTYAVVYIYGCGDGRIGPTRCAVIDAGLGDRWSPRRACRIPPAAAGSGRIVLAAGLRPASTAAPGGSPRSRTTPPSAPTPCGDASLARCAPGTHPFPPRPFLF